MGEIAELMIDGALCQECGVYIGQGQGFPRSCHYCTKGRADPSPGDKVRCKTCGKRVRLAGLKDHQRDAHGAAK